MPDHVFVKIEEQQDDNAVVVKNTWSLSQNVKWALYCTFIVVVSAVCGFLFFHYLV